jgi:hypothetical protein
MDHLGRGTNAVLFDITVELDLRRRENDGPRGKGSFGKIATTPAPEIDRALFFEEKLKFFYALSSGTEGVVVNTTTLRH